MNITEEMAAERGRVPGRTRAQIIEGARFDAQNPDTGLQHKVTLTALLQEIDAGKQRLEVAIRYAARLLQQLNAKP